MNIKKIKKPRRKIPRGDYCYKIKSVNEDGSLDISVCPYWSFFESKPGCPIGHCSYMGLSDDDIGCGLLWDMVKECGVKQ